MTRGRLAALALAVLVAAAGALTLRRLVTGEAAPAPPGDEAEPLLDKRAKLEALGYVEAVVDDPDPKRRGVVLRDARASPGINYECNGLAVRFLDMDGNVVHEIPLTIPAAPTSGCLAEPYRRGLVAAVRRPVLSLSTWNARSRWSRSGGFHHDVAVDARGRLYTFAIRDDVLRRGERVVPIVGQSIVVLGPKGRTEGSLDLLPILGPLVPDERLDRIASLAPREGEPPTKAYVRATDVFHPNSIQLVEWPHGGERGAHALIAIRDLDRVAVVDLARGRIVWEWGEGEVIGPHDPWLLGNGNVLFFDNGDRPNLAKSRGYSRVVEVDPRIGAIAWQYRADPPNELFSPSRGGAQPLPNGDVLVTDSGKGRVFEVTREGEIVWDFWNTDFGAEDGRRKSIYRMYRMTQEEFDRLRIGR